MVRLIRLARRPRIAAGSLSPRGSGHARGAAGVLAVVALLGAGCAADPTPPPAMVVLDIVPEDLTLAITVQPVADRGDEGEMVEAHRRRARMVLFADGTLHYGEAARGENRDASLVRIRIDVQSLPPRVRVLNRAQMEEIWLLLSASGLGSPERGAPPQNFAFLAPPESGVRYIVDVTANDERWVVVENADDPPPRDSAAASIVRRLARLAWASELADPEYVIVPARYDLGPDPYKRYRRR